MCVVRKYKGALIRAPWPRSSRKAGVLANENMPQMAVQRIKGVLARRSLRVERQILADYMWGNYYLYLSFVYYRVLTILRVCK